MKIYVEENLRKATEETVWNRNTPQCLVHERMVTMTTMKVKRYFSIWYCMIFGWILKCGVATTCGIAETERMRVALSQQHRKACDLQPLPTAAVWITVGRYAHLNITILFQSVVGRSFCFVLTSWWVPSLSVDGINLLVLVIDPTHYYILPDCK